jgi:hypothetical protein
MSAEASALIVLVSQFFTYIECFYTTYDSTQSLEHTGEEINVYRRRTRIFFPCAH